MGGIEMRYRDVLKILGVAVVLGLLVSACGGAAAPTPPAENMMVYGYVSTITDFDPSVSCSDEGAILANVYEGLLKYNVPGSTELLSPWLATSWESNEDATEWTFHLRQGVKFHDGTDFNAEAVKYSIDRTMEMGMGSSYIWEPVEEIEVVDDYTVRFRLSYPAPLDLISTAQYASWIMSPTCTEAHDSDWFNEGHDCGSGPYIIESRERGQRTVMTRFDDYWGGWKEGQFNKVIFEIVEDTTVRQQMLEAGDVDVTFQLPRENLEALDARDDITVYSNPSFQNLLALLNHKKPPLDNKLVRQAISYTFPYKDYIDKVHMGYAVQSRGTIPTGMFGHGDDLFQYTYDLEKAKELLAEAGYPGGGFDLLLTYCTGDLDEKQAAELWKPELAKVGINLEIREMGWEAEWDFAKSDPAVAQDIFLFYWWPDFVSPYSFLFNMFHCEEDILWNLGYVCNAELDQMMDQARELSGSNRAEAERLFIQAQETLVDEADAVFICDMANIHVVRSDIKGYADNPAYPHAVFFYELSR
jgi:peptide/nickel transport system substrate-binding protein